MKGERQYSDEQKAENDSRAQRWAARNKHRRREIANAWYARHREEVLAKAKAKTAAQPKSPKLPPKGRDPEKAKLRRIKWQTANREKANAAQRERRAKDLAGVREKERAYRAEHKNQIKAALKRWAEANPEKLRVQTRRRRARKRGAEGAHTAADIARIRASQRDMCACCGTKLRGKGHVDHIVAITKGGSNWPSNLQMLCQFCNISKNNQDPIVFMQSRGRLL